MVNICSNNLGRPAPGPVWHGRGTAEPGHAPGASPAGVRAGGDAPGVCMPWHPEVLAVFRTSKFSQNVVFPKTFYRACGGVGSSFGDKASTLAPRGTHAAPLACVVRECHAHTARAVQSASNYSNPSFGRFVEVCCSVIGVLKLLVHSGYGIVWNCHPFSTVFTHLYCCLDMFLECFHSPYLVTKQVHIGLDRGPCPPRMWPMSLSPRDGLGGGVRTGCAHTGAEGMRGRGIRSGGGLWTTAGGAEEV